MPAASTITPARVQSDQSPTTTAAEIVAPRIEPPVDSQCMRALARANEVRLARAALKRDVAAGRRDVAEVVSELPWEVRSMALAELLCSQSRWGRARSRKLLNSLSLSEGKQLGTLTERQQGILVHALEAKSRTRVMVA
ncbi:MAG: hypothetical protein ACRDL6_07380 [Solirubrobacterales bacterium]